MNKICSFDVFDTCLIRKCGKPENVFRLLAKCFFDEFSSIYFDFIRERENVESRLQKKQNKKVVSFDEIYDEFNFALFDSLDKNVVKYKELEIESKQLLGVYQTREILKSKRQNKFKIVFISDMYLSKSYILKILKRESFFEEGDSLYVSVDYGETKNNGKLYDFVRSDLKPEKWEHFGDNSYSDLKMAKSKNISAHLINTDFTEIENKWLSNSNFLFNKFYIELFAGAARSVRLSNQHNNKIEFAANVISGLYLPYVIHVLDDARKRGIRKLFFVSRDSYIFYQIALSIKINYLDLEFIYLYISRKCVYLPSLYNCELNDFDECKFDFIGNSFNNILQILNLKKNEIKNLVNLEFDFDFDKVITVETLPIVKSILADSKIKKYISIESSKARSLLLVYLTQEDLLSNLNNIGLVDLGWKGTTQVVLNKILVHEGFKPIFSYYLGVFENRLNREKTDNYKSMLFFKEDLYDNFTLTFVLEDYFSANEYNSTIGYKIENNKAVPVFSSKALRVVESEISKVNIDVCSDVLKIFLENCSQNTMFISVLENCGLPTLFEFVRNPTINQVRVFEKIIIDDPLLGKSNLIIKLYVFDLFMIFIFNSLISRKRFWIVGSLIYNFKIINKPVVSIYYLLRRFDYIFSKLKILNHK